MSEIVYTPEQLAGTEELIGLLFDESKRPRPANSWDTPLREASLAGGAGVGKTTITREVVARARELKVPAVFGIAPTWRAAREQRKATGLQSTSCHKFLYTPPRRGEDTEDESWGMPRKGEKLRFSLQSQSEYLCIPKGSLLLVDEASMIGEQLARDIRKVAAWRDLRVLWVGDDGQLPPVQEAPGVDLSRASIVLRQIHRQAAGNPIISFCSWLREGRSPGSYAFDEAEKERLWILPRGDSGRVTIGTCVRAWLKRADHAWDPEVGNVDVAMITFRNLDRRVLNRAVQAERLKSLSLALPEEVAALADRAAEADGAEIPPVICVGERVVATANGGMFNGDLGVVAAIRPIIRSLHKKPGSDTRGAEDDDEEEAWSGQEKEDLAEEYRHDSYPLCELVVRGPAGEATLILAGRATEAGEGTPAYYLPRRWQQGEARILKEEYDIEIDRAPELGYALTCHRAQGSSINRVLVIKHPYSSPRTQDERRRWDYTAASRAALELKWLTCDELPPSGRG